MENWPLIVILAISGLVGIITRRTLVAGLVAALFVSWPAWIAALFSNSNFLATVTWTLMFSVAFFVPSCFAGFIGTKLASKFNLPKWNKLIVLALITLVGLYFVAPVAIEMLKKKEWTLLVDFVKGDDEVKKTSGDNAAIFILRERRSRWALLPSSYEISIRGSKQNFAVVDVSRSWWSPTFSVACVTSIEGIRVKCDK
jgi:hypothetical protein